MDSFYLLAHFRNLVLLRVLPKPGPTKENESNIMEAFFISTGVVALGEMGDKTQLLSLLLSVRYRTPVPIIFGILVATLLNHGTAGALGAWLTTAISPDIIKWILGISFIAISLWTLVPDTIGEQSDTKSRFGVFGSTLVAFFLAEMGDKTQVATIALAARFHSLLPVVAGTTLGMLLADVPVVLLGEKISKRIPIRTIRVVAALVFFVLGVMTLIKI